MDADQNERLYISEIEAFVMPHLRQVLQLSTINKTSYTLTLSEMTHNIALHIMRKSDVDKNGFIESVDVTKLSLDDPVAYALLEDLYNHAADFMDKYRVVISGTKSISGSSSMSKIVGSQLRKSMNRDLDNLQSQAKQTTMMKGQQS